jgi:hypothetical protein
MLRIHWTFFLQVKSKAKCEAMAKKLSSTLEMHCINPEMEKYWKDESLFRATAATDLPATTGPDLHRTMATANLIATHWTVGRFDSENWQLYGHVADGTIHIAGVTFATFSTERI